MVENVIIIGGGPAGLAAAVYNSRANLSPLLFAGSPSGGQLMLTSEVENYPGFEHILGPELVEKMKQQAIKFGTRVKEENVASVDFSKQPFTVTASSGVYSAKAILIATGAKALWLGLESETRLRAHGVSACATCDGFFFKNKVVGVVGGGDTAMEEALTLTKFATKVYVIHRRDSFKASKIMQERVANHPKIEIMWNTSVEEVLGEVKVEGVRLESVKREALSVERSTQHAPRTTQDLALDGLFIAIGHKPDTDLFKDKITLDEKGYIITSAQHALTSNLQPPTSNLDYNYPSMTSIPGVFAAGDCVDHVYRQAATAVGMAVAAALEIERWLEIRG